MYTNRNLLEHEQGETPGLEFSQQEQPVTLVEEESSIPGPFSTDGGSGDYTIDQMEGEYSAKLHQGMFQDMMEEFNELQCSFSGYHEPSYNPLDVAKTVEKLKELCRQWKAWATETPLTA